MSELVDGLVEQFDQLCELADGLVEPVDELVERFDGVVGTRDGLQNHANRSRISTLW